MSRVESFYDAYGEREWLRLERHRTEFAVTLRALNAALPPTPARVLDIGAGPGRYSVALAAQGYQVTLVDLSATQLAQARDHAERSAVSLEAVVQADALALPATVVDPYDAVLLFGPLYHLKQMNAGRRSSTAYFTGSRAAKASVGRGSSTCSSAKPAARSGVSIAWSGRW